MLQQREQTRSGDDVETTVKQRRDSCRGKSVQRRVSARDTGNDKDNSSITPQVNIYCDQFYQSINHCHDVIFCPGLISHFVLYNGGTTAFVDSAMLGHRHGAQKRRLKYFLTDNAVEYLARGVAIGPTCCFLRGRG